MEYLTVGTIIGTHGIKGEVKVKSTTSFKEARYKVGNTLYLKNTKGIMPITIDSYRTHKGNDLLTFNKLTNINDVLRYVGSEVVVRKDELEELNEDDYYYDELIGLDVYLETGEAIGRVIDIMEVPQGEILVVESKNDKEILIPFVDEYIILIDLAENKMVTNWQEGE